ncbi:hypothetical protein [Salinimicrobium sp. GXAS 041]|uniref:hypothetical protein n=1 Tax=Salinimicrobium sp. GXAS 041 TaxID=3400806 RepID=UPI003C740C65
MKRYLIYGFLTILIITLNFAFIIVLITDDVRINYRVLFLLWVVVLMAAGGLAYLEKTRKKKKKRAAATSKAVVKPQKINVEAEDKFKASNIYKNKCIKKTRIQLPESLTNKIKPGFFAGYVTNEEYANETVQAVYTSGDQLLGYINKKDEQLCENLELLYNEPVPCWGIIQWEDYEKRFFAKTYIPVLYSEPETNKFRKLAALKEELIALKPAPEKTLYPEYLQKVENFYYQQQSFSVPGSLEYTIDPQGLTVSTRELSQHEKWKELRRLKKYPILLSRLKHPEKKEILCAIQNAENHLPT